MASGAVPFASPESLRVISSMFLRIELPAISTGKYKDIPGLYILDRVRFLTGGSESYFVQPQLFLRDYIESLTDEEAKRFIAPKPPRTKTLPLHEIARKTASIRANTVARQKAYAERLALAEGIKKAQIHQTMKMERDALLGASMHGYLLQSSHNRLQELTRLLDAK